jgi:hypothetical protein
MNNSKFTAKVDWRFFEILAEKIAQFGSPGFSFSIFLICQTSQWKIMPAKPNFQFL